MKQKNIPILGKKGGKMSCLKSDMERGTKRNICVLYEFSWVRYTSENYETSPKVLNMIQNILIKYKINIFKKFIFTLIINHF